MAEPKRTRSTTRPTRRRRTTRKAQDEDAAPDVALDSGSPEAPLESVVVISPPAYSEPPSERRGRSRADDDFGANVDSEIVFPEEHSGPSTAAPQARQRSDAEFVERQGDYRRDYPDRESGQQDDYADREGGEGYPRRRRRRRRRRGGGSGNGEMGQRRGPQQQRPYGQQQRPYGQQRDYAPRDQYRPRGNFRSRGDEILPDEQTTTMEGVLELHPKGYGFLRDPKKNYGSQESDPFVSSSLIEKSGLREGVKIIGQVGAGTRGQGPRLKTVEMIDGMSAEDYAKVKKFDDLTAITPNSRIKLEIGSRPITMRVMDLLTPIGRGQRALIVAPPRTGKTMLLQEIAESVSRNHPDMHLIVLLIDERPEEVTEMRRHVKGEVIASSLDSDTESHVRISQLIIERSKRLAEEGKDVFILMDSITRAARAFNKWTNTGRTATGGLDVRALDIPKKMFGSARQFDEGGSLTIVATALIDTGSRADEAIFQEFKGTGNMELVLSRDLADRRIWPAIDITKSGTRHEEKLFAAHQFESIIMLRRSLISLSPVEAMEQLTRTLERFPSNNEFLEKVKSVL